MTTNKQEFNLRNGFDKNQSHTLNSLVKLSGYSRYRLQKVYDRGIGAWKTNIRSVRTEGSFKKNENLPRSKKLSKEQWAFARVYSFINKLQKGVKLNHDTDLVKQV